MIQQSHCYYVNLTKREYFDSWRLTETVPVNHGPGGVIAKAFMNYTADQVFRLLLSEEQVAHNCETSIHDQLINQTRTPTPRLKDTAHRRQIKSSTVPGTNGETQFVPWFFGRWVGDIVMLCTGATEMVKHIANCDDLHIKLRSNTNRFMTNVGIYRSDGGLSSVAWMCIREYFNNITDAIINGMATVNIPLVDESCVAVMVKQVCMEECADVIMSKIYGAKAGQVKVDLRWMTRRFMRDIFSKFTNYADWQTCKRWMRKQLLYEWQRRHLKDYTVHVYQRRHAVAVDQTNDVILPPVPYVKAALNTYREDVAAQCVVTEESGNAVFNRVKGNVRQPHKRSKVLKRVITINKEPTDADDAYDTPGTE